MSGESILSIITVTYNSAHIIRGLLEPIAQMQDVEVIVVDNASTDDTPLVVKELMPNARIIQNSSNVGFAVAVNIGAACAAGDCYLLVNPDAQISPEAIQACLEPLRNSPLVGITAPLVTNPDGRLLTLEAGLPPTLWRVFCHWSGLSRCAVSTSLFEGFFLRASNIHGARRVGWVSGSCMFVSAKAWLDIGGMTERYFMYSEDVDICMQMASAGFEVWLIPHVEASHKIGSSSRQSVSEDPELSVAWCTNTFDVFRRHFHPSALRLWLWRTTFALGLLSRAAMYKQRAIRGSGSTGVDWDSEATRYLHSARVVSALPISGAETPPSEPTRV